jgi:Spy/CpxP family protein refolding chaperone
MKLSILSGTTLALLLAAGTAHAGDPGDHHGRHGPDLEKRVAHMAVELDLSDEQSQQLLAVLQASAAEREALQAKIDEQFKPEMCALHLATKEQVLEILTAEQAAEMEGHLDRMSGVADARGWRGPKGGPMQDCEPES